MTYPVEHQQLASWAKYPVITADVATPATTEEARDYVMRQERLIARGNGKSYGDAALAPHVLSTLALRRIRHFDATSGVIDCEAGVLLSDILREVVPQGWFFHVTPGIKHITVGGAIASDVHGKNHPTHGCFSNYLISFELMTSEGQVVRCSKEENAELFWQTCGGMGWTGLIISARFQLRRITSTQMQQHTVWSANWDELFAGLSGNQQYEYAAAWVDGLAAGANFGRGAVFFANHAEKKGAEPLVFHEKKPGNVPFTPPVGLINRWSTFIHNKMYLRKKPPGDYPTDLDTYFYPLDGIRNWNRMYGPRGFVQYQFCMPEYTAFDGIARVFQAIQRSPDAPFLTVLKRHGERPSEAKYSFPIKGYSLALDFPRTRSVFSLVRMLDEIVWAADGKIYLTKDACSAPKMSRVPLEDFKERKWWSDLRERLAMLP
ncbi:MAG: FAD-binding oxidoreductase [Saprospiraceae bacterium]|nr:FAD-binding oxidoreductase [Saprospiraceae bacterium]